MANYKPPKTPMTKAEKLRRASKVCWIIGAGMTVNFVRVALTATFGEGNELLALVLAFPLAAGIQYVLTLMESALFDGSIPPPWRIDWAEGGPLPWIACGAILCLVLDVLLNIAGVAMFMVNLDAAIANPVFTVSTAVGAVVKVIGTVLFSILFAVGSELLDAFADYADGTPRKTWQPQDQHAPRKQQPSPQEHRAPPADQQTSQIQKLLEREAQAAGMSPTTSRAIQTHKRTVDGNGNIV